MAMVSITIAMGVAISSMSLMSRITDVSVPLFAAVRRDEFSSSDISVVNSYSGGVVNDTFTSLRAADHLCR